MTINRLTAQDAISSSVIHVSADMRLRDLFSRSGLHRGEVYAVFSEPADEDVSREFLGLVSNDSVGRYPCRIFADLLSLSKSLPVDPSAPLDVLYSNFEQEPLDACMVMESGHRFMGAVTYSSLLKTLWRREQLLTARLQQEIGDKILLERQLQHSQQTLDEFFARKPTVLLNITNRSSTWLNA